MNPLRPSRSIILAAVFFLLLSIRRRIAWRYARVLLLLAVATVMLAPFAWLVCAVFKDSTVLNEYSFLPPLSKISHETINLSNFHALLTDQPTVQGPVSFWR